MGIVAQRFAPTRRGFALGIVSAGSSVGQLVAAPLIARRPPAFGWQAAMFALARAAPCSSCRSRARSARCTRLARQRARPTTVPSSRSARACANRNYWLVTAGFFVCGFHVSFLTTHMPGVIDLCGLPAGLSGVWLAVVGACNIVEQPRRRVT